MASYETMFIVHPDHGGRLKEYVDSYKKIVETLGGSFDHVEEWGIRDLAYPIQKQTKGFYSLLRYHSTAGAVEELERTMKLSDGVLRYLTVRLEEGAEQAPRPAAKETAEKAGTGIEEGSVKADIQS